MNIREMSVEDLPQVLIIENLCYTTPWSLSSFRYELGNHDAILKVAVFDDQIIAYVCVRTILDMTHLLNITVVPEFRQHGAGSRLLHNAIEALRLKNPEAKLTLEVRQSNSAAIKLYEKFGFAVTGKRKGYYQQPDDDAILMEIDLHSDK